MPERSTAAKGGGSSWVFLLVASLILGYFAYDRSITGAFLGGLLYILVSISTLIGLIPVLGPLIYWFYLFPKIDIWSHTVAGVPVSWFDNVAMWGGLIAAVIFTILTTGLLILSWRK